MFDVSLSELMVIGVVALVVIGPERLPRVARTLGHLLGRLQRYVGQVKADINREMQLDDIKKFQEQMADEANKIKSSFTSVGDEVRDLETTLKASVTDGVSPEAGVSPPAPIGDNAVLPPLNQSRSGDGKDVRDVGDSDARESAAPPELKTDADDWKLPEPLPEPTDMAKPSPAATEKS